MLPMNSPLFMVVFGLCVLAALIGHMLGERDRSRIGIRFVLALAVLLLLIFGSAFLSPMIAPLFPHFTLEPLPLLLHLKPPLKP
jgi:4-amino-4-deoxy-L-arabinose transferase-like glycosyltransferase